MPSPPPSSPIAAASRRRATQGVLWATVERAATQGISFVVVLVLARLLGPANYGLVTFAATIVLFGQTLLGESFSEALIQAATIEPQSVSSLFWLLCGAGTASGVVLYLTAYWIAHLLDEPALTPILQALAPLLLLTAVQAVPIALFKRTLDFRALAAASATGTILGGVAGIVLAFAGFGPWSLVTNLLVQNTMVTASVWRQSKFRPRFEFSFRHLSELWSYGQYTFLLRIASFIANQGPRILIGWLFGIAPLGAFNLGLRTVEILCQLTSLPAANVAVPVIAGLRRDGERLRAAILAATQLVALIAAPVYVGLAVLAPVAIPVIFGPKWTASIPIVQILSVYGIVGSCGLVSRGIVAGLGRPDINLAGTVAAAVLSVGLLLAASPWGLTAASIAFVIRGFLTLPAQPFVIARLAPVSAGAQYRVLLPIFAAATCMAIAVELILGPLSAKLPPMATMAVASAVATAVFFGALYFFARSALTLGVSVLSDLRPRARPSEA